MIGIAGYYGVSSASQDHIKKWQQLHATPPVEVTAKSFHDSTLAAAVIYRSELDKYEGKDCFFENDDFLFLMEGMVLQSADGRRPGEVFVEKWRNGSDFVRDFNGEFVILLYNKRQNHLFLINDRFGSRPFYYMEQNRKLYFGSEIKSLLALLPAAPPLSPLGVMEFFAFSHNIDDRTLLENIKALPPATILRMDDNGLKIEQYWSLRFQSGKSKGSWAHFMEDSARILRNGAAGRIAHRKQLGLGLSGGLDSRIVAALIPADNRPLAGRTYGTEGSLEVQAAREIGARLNIDLMVHEPREVKFSSFIYPSVWRTEGRIHFTGLKSIIEHQRNKNRFLYNLNGHFGDVLTGKQLRPFMFRPCSREVFARRIFSHYTGYTFKQEERLRSVFNPDFFAATFPELRQRFHESLMREEADHNWDAYDSWDMTNRQPNFTFCSCGVDNYLFEKVTLFTDYEYVDAMLQVPGHLRFGQSLYKTMIARCFPEVGTVVNANTGKKLKKSILGNLADLGSQYLVSQQSRHYHSQGSGGKADLFRKDARMREILSNHVESEFFLPQIFSKTGILSVISDHWDGRSDNSYLLGVLATFVAFHQLFITSPVTKIPDEAKPW